MWLKFKKAASIVLETLAVALIAMLLILFWQHRSDNPHALRDKLAKTCLNAGGNPTECMARAKIESGDW
jgi:hypothetical protein